MYTMNSFILPQAFLTKLDKWTAWQFKISMKPSNHSSTGFLYSELGLKELEQLFCILIIGGKQGCVISISENVIVRVVW